jgi:glycosyltransferase involved in cell wall biosynthesis
MPLGTWDAGPRLLGLDFGAPFHVKTFSGSSRHIWTALARQGVLVDAFTPFPSRPLVLTYKLRAFHPDVREWRARWRRSVPFRAYLSERASQILRTRYAGRYAGLLQIGAYYDVSASVSGPKGLIADNNCAITQRTNRNFQCDEKLFLKQFEFERQVYQSMDRVFCFSDYLAQSMIADFGCDPGRVKVVGAGINLPSDRIHDPARDYSRKTILFVGFDWVNKGGPTLLDAFEIVRRAEPSAQLVLIGPTLSSLPKGVVCHGPLSPAVPNELDLICSAFREATVLVLPTLADAFPNVLREAMAAGLPCVASNIGAIPEMVLDDVTGHLVPSGDAAAFASRLLKVIQDPGQARAKGMAGRARYTQLFTWERVCANISQEMWQLIEHQGEHRVQAVSPQLTQ